MFGKRKKENVEKFSEQIRKFNKELFPNSKSDCVINCLDEKQLVYQLPDSIEQAVLYYTVQKREDGTYGLDCFVVIGSKVLSPEEIK